MNKLAIAFILCWSAAAGAVPNTINFTGRLSTSAGPVTGAVNLTLKLYDAPTDGTPLWTEIHGNVGADNGMVFLDAGTLTTLDETVFNGNRLYLELVVGTETLAPRLAINSVPYALRTAAATSADFLGTSIGPDNVVTSVNAGAGIVAARTGNAVAVSLSTTGCLAGHAYKYNGTTFACAPDSGTTYTGTAPIKISGTAVSLSSTGCAVGAAWEWNGSAWACTVPPGTGSCTWATVSSTAATLSAVCPADKHAVTGGCDAGTSGTLVSSRPSGATAPPANGALGSTVNQWSCQYSSTTTTHVAYALCCAQ